MIARRVALVTTSKGIGRAIARALASDGCDIAVAYNADRTAANACVAELKGLGANAEAFQADVCRADQCQQLVDSVIARFERLDILVNAVGPFTRDRTLFGDYSVERIRNVLEGNLFSAMALDSLALPYLRAGKAGRIIHFGFGRAGETPAWPQRAVYAAAKAGLVSLTKSLSVEESRNLITVNMVCPGEIKGNAKEQLIAHARGLIDDENPGMRPGTGEDVARVVVFLCRAESDYITGTVIDVAGGLDPIRPLHSRLAKEPV